MRYGRLLAIAGILVSCLLGCALHRSSSVHDSGKSEEQTRHDQLYARADARVSTSSTIAERWRKLRIVRREFDLDKPKDEKGNFPVKSETILEGDERQKEEIDKKEEEKSDSEESLSKTKSSSDARSSGSETNTEIKAGVNPLWWWLAGILTAIVSLIFLGWKYGKKNQAKRGLE